MALVSTNFAPATDSALAHNYTPLPVELATADGCWVTDSDGGRYIDLLAGYSALNFGHRHPRLVEAAHRQLDRLTLTSRAFGNDRLGAWSRRLSDLVGLDMVLPMNTGAEAVETAIKVARRWGYDRRGVLPDRARIVVCENNFHGRTTTIISFSSDSSARDGFGPFTPGFDRVPFGDADALEKAIGENTVAVLLEPIQGEAGVIVPPDGYLREARRICSAFDVLLIADEIQSGLGRTGRTFACDHESIQPDMYILGKALAGGIIPLSAVVADEHVLSVIRPGEHGSTFGGNPLACAVGTEVLALLESCEPQDNAARCGPVLAEVVAQAGGDAIVELRWRGLWVGADLRPDLGTGRDLCLAALDEGLLMKDTHGQTVRFAPPLVITEAELAEVGDRLSRAFRRLRGK
ncbi:MAG TPA: ornithine--oxo-acid transaminase [Acidimicrobiales bacterium]|jgi:ornithine--oxo-acid transaminase